MLQNIEELMNESRSVAGINYWLLIHHHFESFRKSVTLNKIAEAGDSANSFLFIIQKLEYFDLHLKLGQSLVEFFERFPPVLALPTILQQLAVTYDLQKKFTEAEKCFHKALSVVTPLAQNDKNARYVLASLWYNRAQQARNGESKQELRSYAEKALEIFEELENTPAVVVCLVAISHLTESKQAEERRKICAQALDIGKTLNDNNLIALAQINLGLAEIELNNMAYGLSLVKDSIAIIEKNSTWRYIALAYTHLAEALAKCHKHAEAQKELNYAKEIFRRNKIELYWDKVNEVQQLIEQSSAKLA
jgi:tetratricopeptide (TPR) repeat protein